MVKKVIIVSGLIMFFLINPVKAQNINDTLYFDVADQWSIKYYWITDTVTGEACIVNRVKFYAQILQQLQFDSTNCVLKIEAKRRFWRRNLIVFIKPNTVKGRYLRLGVCGKEICYVFRKKRFGVI